MHASTALLAVCSAAAALVTSSYAKPLAARQGDIAIPSNTTFHAGQLIDLVPSGLLSIVCGPGQGINGTVPLNYGVGVNPEIWNNGNLCGVTAVVWYRGVGFPSEVTGECLQCGENDIGLYPDFFKEVTGSTHRTAVEGEWVVFGVTE